MVHLSKSNFIDGNWFLNKNLEVREIRNPAQLTEVIGKIHCADNYVVNACLKAALSATKEWKKTSIEERIDLVHNLLGKLFENQQEIAKIITSENGKTINESVSEVKAAIAESKFQMDYVKNHLIELSENAEIRYEALGIFLAITPWNFPLATIMRKIVPALISGNTVIVKPSEHAPLTPVALFKLVDKVGFPNGVLNLLNGDGAKIGPLLIKSDYIKSISFTGSDNTGRLISNQIAGRDIRFQAEMGGSNAVVVMQDANLELVIPDIISNAYACGGQWCTGTSRVIVVNEIYKTVVELLKKESAKIVLGNGIEEGVTMGPLSNNRQFKDVKNKIERATQQGAKLEIGETDEESQTKISYHIRPTIISGLNINSELANEEIFGPVITIYKANGLMEAISMVNSNPYGLSNSIYTEDEESVNLFIEEIESGLVHVNLPTAYRHYNMPLMGWKNSGMGIPECGRFMLDLCTKPKVIYRK